MRVVVGAAGLALMAVGGLLVWDQATHWDVLFWLAGAAVLHDAIIAPLVLAAGLLTGGVKSRGLLRGTLLTAGCLTLIALPVLLRPLPAANPSVVPLDYVRGLLVSLGVLIALALLLGALRWARERRGRRAGATGGG